MIIKKFIFMENVNSEALAFKVKKKADSILPFLKTGDFWFPLLAAFTSFFIGDLIIPLSAVFILFALTTKRRSYYAKEFVVFIVMRVVIVLLSELFVTILPFYPFLGVILLLALFNIPVTDFKRVRREIQDDTIGMAQNEESVTNTKHEVSEIMINSGRGLVKLCLKSKRFVSMFTRVIFLVFIVMFSSIAVVRGCNDEMCGVPVFLGAVLSVIVSFPAIIAGMAVATKGFKKSVLAHFIFSMMVFIFLLQLMAVSFIVTIFLISMCVPNDSY